jgi:predicted RNA-binding protein YlxR (DUF448 family)
MAPPQPVRTCVGCRTATSKDALIRVVAGPHGPIVDAAGTMAGRGAYVHRDLGCVALAVERRGFARALHTEAAGGEAVRLRDDLERLIGAV